MTNRFESLRLKRLKHRVQRQEIAVALNCSPGWITRLERDPYSGPAAGKWELLYQAALDELIQERKATTR